MIKTCKKELTGCVDKGSCDIVKCKQPFWTFLFIQGSWCVQTSDTVLYSRSDKEIIVSSDVNMQPDTT